MSQHYPADMRISPTQALRELDFALSTKGPIDVAVCRRLALRATASIADPAAAEIMHEELCDIIAKHAKDADHARQRLGYMRPVIESLAALI